MTEHQRHLRARLSAIDPMHPNAVPAPLAPGRAPYVLEKTMAIIQSDPETAADSRRPSQLRLIVIAGAAAVAVAAATITAVVLNGGSEPSASARSTLSLSLGSGDTMSSCIPFDVEFLRDMPVAFAGTVSETSAEAVTLDVDHWYAGGSADVVSHAVAQPKTPARSP